VNSFNPTAAALHASGPMRFTYSTLDQPKLQQLIIQGIELLGGQRKLRRLYFEHIENLQRGEGFFDSAMRLLNINVDYDQNALSAVPKTGPVIFISNHPYGVLDGITLTWLALKARPDTKVLANDVLCQSPEAAANLLPVAFAPTREALETNVRTRMAAQDWLKQGHAIGIFPGGGVSTTEKPFMKQAVDLPWAPFTAKLVRSSGATVVPVFFSGQNSRLFQIASHISLTLRLSLVFRETARRIGTDLGVRIGKPTPFHELAHLTNREDLILELRRRTFGLAQPEDVRGDACDLHLRQGRVKGWKQSN
jgi:putative hemolysin